MHAGDMITAVSVNLFLACRASLCLVMTPPPHESQKYPYSGHTNEVEQYRKVVSQVRDAAGLV